MVLKFTAMGTIICYFTSFDRMGSREIGFPLS